MTTDTPDSRPRIFAATVLEACAARCELRGVTVTRTGVGIRRPPNPVNGSMALLCGLAGGLKADLAPGTVVVPEEVGLTDGTRIRCHREWVEALAAAASELGHSPETGQLLTAPSLVTGDARAFWAQRGYVAADMETGLLAMRGWQVATVRLILDTPVRSIARDWERPMRAIFRPRLWGELLWLAHSAPRYSWVAARIVRRALELSSGPGRTDSATWQQPHRLGQRRPPSPPSPFRSYRQLD
ncbi:MAG: hypothetical protein DLM70_15435 [Chloroflexi bacterium]|nr:MAG: hypothetical protein DLM70_15435 [Chloroflexota bacterium]